MLNKKIALSLMSIAAALTVTGGAAYAAFSDVAQSTGNTFSSGNADLDIAPDNAGTAGTFGDNLSDAFNVSNVVPGYDESHLFWLTNSSSSNIDMDMVVDVSNYVASNAESTALADNLLVSWRCDLDNDNSIDDETFTPEFSVKAWFDGGNSSLGTIANSDVMFCQMRTRVPSTVDNTIANGSVDFDVAFNATQQ